MGSRSMYTEKQWEWVAARRREGYPLTDLADFLGLTKGNIRYIFKTRRLISYIPKHTPDRTLPTLESRKKEFVALGDYHSD